MLQHDHQLRMKMGIFQRKQGGPLNNKAPKPVRESSAGVSEEGKEEIKQHQESELTELTELPEQQTQMDTQNPETQLTASFSGRPSRRLVKNAEKLTEADGKLDKKARREAKVDQNSNAEKPKASETPKKREKREFSKWSDTKQWFPHVDGIDFMDQFSDKGLFKDYKYLFRDEEEEQSWVKKEWAEAFKWLDEEIRESSVQRDVEEGGIMARASSSDCDQFNFLLKMDDESRTQFLVTAKVGECKVLTNG